MNYLPTWISYWEKWKGRGKGMLPGVPSQRHLLSTFLASFIGIATIAALHYKVPTIIGLSDSGLESQWLIGSFGASAVLLYALPESPLSQPRNLIVGHVLSAVVGVTINYILPHESTRWLACALAASLAITLMQLTRTVHPPGGATAVIAVSQESMRKQGFFYVVFPVLTGALTMLLIALVINNILLTYPSYWCAPTSTLGGGDGGTDVANVKALVPTQEDRIELVVKKNTTDTDFRSDSC